MTEHARSKDRNTVIYRRVQLMGHAMADVAAEYGLTPQRIGQIVKAIEQERKALYRDYRDQLLAESVELARHVREEALAVAELEGAPLTAGKDGEVVYDPETGAVVRDYGGRLAAHKVALAADEQMARRLGLNAPTQVETTAKVRYVVEGVDPEDLT